MDNYLQFGKYTAGCPQWLQDKVKFIKPTTIDEAYIIEILKVIKEEFNPTLHTITTTHDFKISRFITVNEILEKRQRSCGSLVSVVASVLRCLGLPTKLIDGMFIKNNPNMKHAWIEVFIGGAWAPFDIMQKDFKLTSYHIKKGEYVDWQELEDNS